MLLNLSIRHFVIVDQLELEFDRGFTVLTGETGAGKSILLDALGLLLGGRGEGNLVRHGAPRAELAARFNIHGVDELQQWLKEQALENEENELLLRRVIDAAGRSKSFINGQAVTLAQLKAAGSLLVEIHGQHAHQGLLKSDIQRQLLDAYAGAVDTATDLKSVWQQWQHIKAQRLEAEQHAADYESERERLDWQLQELAELALQEGEWEQLSQQHSRLAHAAELLESAEQARYTLAEGEHNSLAMLAQVQTRLGRLAHFDSRINDTLSLLASAEAELQEAVYALRAYVDDVEQDPSELQRLERRIEKLHDMARKYRTRPEELPAVEQRLQLARAALEQRAQPEALREEEAKLEKAYQEIAEQLSRLRQQAAPQLAARVEAEMQSLAMGGARFAIELSACASPTAYGLEQVEYLVSANAGMSLRPLAKVASGGELSRISLALQVVTSRLAAVPTLIFDEVDVGIGGRVAEIVGKKLRQLGQHYQVLCVTHLPQVAACGAQHWQVSKHTDHAATFSQIHVLNHAERTQEIARMLGGEHLTAATLQHAEEMLLQSRQHAENLV
ncbi:DNA repair protein RecN [Aquaspirillum serpens]|uniref:DNA repair protein RecN n=1 Tax=Aquaspirillum serpens TaxID=190 RepID=UPI0003B7B793|nr:DNA repair protein RecN [Aquaspirillum serpens]